MLIVTSTMVRASTIPIIFWSEKTAQKFFPKLPEKSLRSEYDSVKAYIQPPLCKPKVYFTTQYIAAIRRRKFLDIQSLYVYTDYKAIDVYDAIVAYFQ